MANYSRSLPFNSKIISRNLLNKPGSSKENYHLSLDTMNSGIHYQVGSSVGILSQNHPELVDKYLQAFRANGKEKILDPRSQEEIYFEDFLFKKANLLRTTKAQIEKIPEFNLQDPTNLHNFLSSHEPIDILNRFPQVYSIEEWVKACAPLLPRFYSIASSPYVSPHQIDLLVSLISYQYSDEVRYGVASFFLCKTALIDLTPIPLYIQPAPHFHLPSDPETSIIMIGPGTGVAPYRGFLQEREFLSAPGKNWLFFGDREKAYDFLYEDFWETLVKKGKLVLDTAFSRDQSHKCYVQHKIIEKKKEIWSWIEEGASIYICGDAQRMAKDVEAAFLKIFESEGNLSFENAREYLKKLRQNKRYLSDVY